MSKNNNNNNDDETKNVHHARNVKNHFTIAQIARELNVNEKIARRRFRDAIKRDDERVINARERDNVRDDMRVKHEFRDTQKNRELITSIITNS